MTHEEDTMCSLPLLADLTYREWHAFVNGVYLGVVAGGRKHEYDREKHYWRMGYLLGTGVRYGSLFAAIKLI